MRVFCGGKRFAVICAAWLFTLVGVVEPRFGVQVFQDFSLIILMGNS